MTQKGLIVYLSVIAVLSFAIVNETFATVTDYQTWTPFTDGNGTNGSFPIAHMIDGSTSTAFYDVSYRWYTTAGIVFSTTHTINQVTTYFWWYSNVYYNSSYYEISISNDTTTWFDGTWTPVYVDSGNFMNSTDDIWYHPNVKWVRIYTDGVNSMGDMIAEFIPQFNTWLTPPETCYDGIKNQDETSIDNGWVCGSQVCGYEYVNNRYRVNKFTGSLSTYTKTFYWRATSTGADLWADRLEAQYMMDYTESGASSDNRKALYINGAYIYTWSIDDLFNGVGLHLKVPWYIQSPLQWSNIYGDSGIKLWSERPIQWMSIAGTGSFIMTASGTIRNDGGTDIGKWLSLVTIWDDNWNPIKFPWYPDGIPVDKTPYATYWETTGLFWPVNGFNQHMTLVFPSKPEDVSYIIKTLDVWYMWDQITEEYICRKADGSGSQNGTPIDSITLDEITGKNDTTRAGIANGTLSWDFTFSFGDAPEVSSGASCSGIIDQDSRTFLYGSGGSSSKFNLQNNFVITKDPWTCSFSLTGTWWWDLCKTAWTSTNSILKTVFDVQTIWVGSVLNPIQDSLKYIGTPHDGKHYCFMWKNMVFHDRMTSYTDWDGTTHSMPYNTLNNLDLLILAMMTISSIAILAKFFSTWSST